MEYKRSGIYALPEAPHWADASLHEMVQEIAENGEEMNVGAPQHIVDSTENGDFTLFGKWVDETAVELLIPIEEN